MLNDIENEYDEIVEDFFEDYCNFMMDIIIERGETQMRNPVAKHMNSLNRPVLHVDKKTKERNRLAKQARQNAKKSWLYDLI